MNVKKNGFVSFFICVFVLCALLSVVLPGCRTTNGFVSDRTELVWANAEVYGRIRSAVEQLSENNGAIERRCQQFEQNNAEFGDTVESLRSAIEKYIELCRFAVEQTKRQGAEIKKLQEIVGGVDCDDSPEQTFAHSPCDTVYETEN